VQKHLEFLGVLYLIWGALAGLLGVSAFALAAGAGMIITASAHADEHTRVAAGLTAATFAMLGIVALAWGAVHAVTGRALRQRMPWSRAGALTLAVVNLLFLPFGTALGVYTLWVLQHDETRRL
jgi:hypothetical protein